MYYGGGKKIPIESKDPDMIYHPDQSSRAKEELHFYLTHQGQ
jgi:hypothetical protein